MKLKNIQQIQGRVQHYLWGAKDECIVSQLSTSKHSPFAEIWYGSHKRLPSFIYNTETPIETELPFLLKFLSIAKPLSIQIHPKQEVAEKLFKEDPVHYIDPYAKPELCIPLTEFHAFLGYLDEELIQKQMNDNPPVKNVLQWKENTDIYSIITKAHSLSKEEIHQFVNEMKTFINKKREQKEELSRHQLIFDRLYENFEDDVGLIIAFFLRYEIFQPYDAFFIQPNHPHAYISGECIEAMASSDNVIRFGLTPKFCDLNALKYIDHCHHQNRLGDVEKEIITIKSEDIQASQSIRYINPQPYLNNFSVTNYTITKGCTIEIKNIRVALFVLYKGSIEIDNVVYHMGSSFLIQQNVVVCAKALEEASIVILN